MVEKKKACKKCKTLYEGADKCPNCGSAEFVDNWKGRVIILNPESEIGKKINIGKPGSYAIKTR